MIKHSLSWSLVDSVKATIKYVIITYYLDVKVDKDKHGLIKKIKSSINFDRTPFLNLKAFIKWQLKKLELVAVGVLNEEQRGTDCDNSIFIHI